MIARVGARPLLAASILAADFARLGEAIQAAEAGGADWIHLDVMDGHFVPNLSMGPVVVEACRRITRLPLDVHLMVETPRRFVAAFVDAGADRISVHVEADDDLAATLGAIRDLGARPGVALNPETPADAIHDVLAAVDTILVMTVHPGAAGQSFLPDVLPKLRLLRARRDQIHAAAILAVDGGINAATAPQAARAGAEVFVAASAVFAHPRGIAAGLADLRAAVEPAPPG
jgi:ribulose-phosphate 3-epimerase